MLVGVPEITQEVLIDNPVGKLGDMEQEVGLLETIGVNDEIGVAFVNV